MNRTVLVTGATSGIGRASCVDQLSEGRRVIGIGRDFSKFSSEDPNFTPVKLDLGNLDRLPKRLKKLTADYPEVDTLVLCAGRGLFGDLEQYSYEQMRDLMDLNFLSPVYLTRAFLPLMKQRGFGDVILMGSEAGLAGKSHGSIYCASKAALRSFAQSLRQEASASGIRVTIINPGMVNTAFFEGLTFEPGPDEANAIDVHDVAETVAMILNLRGGTVTDEINLSPLKTVVRSRKSGKTRT
jgi:NADP-dependent 3-hydroxy acid dehydrogenase YdfG